MINDATLKILQRLSSDLVLIDMSSPLEEWRAVADASDALAASLRDAGEDEAHEMAVLMGSVAGSLSNGIIANPEAGVKVVRHIIGALQGLESPGGMSESLRKQAQAEAMLFFKDIKKEESRVKAATTFEDDEEQREMLMAIEARVDELEADLLNLNPPESDSETVRSIFRQFHTLKGEGAICGYKGVADFCHGIETEIEAARSGKLVLTSSIVSVLQELSGLIRPILAGESREEIGEDLIDALMDELRQAVAESKQSGIQTSAEAEAEAEAAGTGEDKFADFFSGFEPPPEDMVQAEPAELEEEEESEQEAAEKAAALAELFGDEAPTPAPADSVESEPSLDAAADAEGAARQEDGEDKGKTDSLSEASEFLAALEADLIPDSGTTGLDRRDENGGGSDTTVAAPTDLVEQPSDDASP
ncbi:MAG: Hpt domain-containing protein, partial [Planctomycetes bacterium]|nr:Hpt domain-containing protein [Planctomycetota bacterium]